MALATSERYMSEAAATSPSHAAVVLYDEAISALKTSITAISGDDTSARCSAIGSATEAITTLYLNLDVKRSGEIADSLANLYGYVLGRLMRVNLYNDSGIAEELIELLEPLRDSWADLDGFISQTGQEMTRKVNGKANGSVKVNGKANGSAKVNGSAKANGSAKVNGKQARGKRAAASR